MGERFVSLRSTSQNSEMAIRNVAEQRVRTSKELYDLISSTIREALLGWDCGREWNIRVTNKHGASLSRENVIASLRARDEAQIQEENRKVAAQA